MKYNLTNCLRFISAGMAFFGVLTGFSQPVELAKPSPEKIAFQDIELGVLIHYSIDTYAPHGAIP
jgi:hypothetical protein